MSSNRLSPTCHSFVLGAGMFGWTLTHAHANIVATQVQIILHTERVFGQDSLGEEKNHRVNVPGDPCDSRCRCGIDSFLKRVEQTE